MTSQTNRHPVVGSLTVLYGLIRCLIWGKLALLAASAAATNSSEIPSLIGVGTLAVLLSFLAVSVMLVISGRGMCFATPAFDPRVRFRIVVTVTLLLLKTSGFGLLALVSLSNTGNIADPAHRRLEWHS